MRLRNATTEDTHDRPAGKGRIDAMRAAGRDNRRVSLVIDYGGARAMPGSMPQPQPQPTPEQAPQQEATPQTNSGT